MTKLTDRAYLLNDQYKDAANLNARIELHERFSTNPQRWQRWVFEQLDLAPDSRILELGGGPGRLWLENVERIPDSWDITLSDFSAGMLREARHNLRGSPRRFRFGVIDAQAIPFEDERFDAVIANHMLFHVPDRPRAIAEIRRVLRSPDAVSGKPGGRLFASTIGRDHLREMDELIGRFDLALALRNDRPSERFTLETGPSELGQWFSSVTLRRHADALHVTEAGPLIAYILSGFKLEGPAETRRAEFARFVEQEVAALGRIYITKDSGLFEAW